MGTIFLWQRLRDVNEMLVEQLASLLPKCRAMATDFQRQPIEICSLLPNRIGAAFLGMCAAEQLVTGSGANLTELLCKHFAAAEGRSSGEPYKKTVVY